MKLEIVSDTICPWCFIGKRRLERALAEKPVADLDIGWRPFQLNPDMPLGGMDRQAYLELKFGGPDRARQVYDPIHDAGKGEGIPFAFGQIKRTPNTLNSHRLIRRAAAAGLQDAVVETLFRAYFLEGRDIEDPASLAAIAEAAGMDRAETQAYLESDADLETVRAEDMMARQMGIQGVPCFIFDRKYAVSGAQTPEVFHEVFEMAAKEAAEAPA
ncbi:MAG: DsbA family oxidoreductase [Alphaproteobacteria bacterium]|nr:DsbA family oxidoreductase [Alphaproteobacteria bacterium]